MKWGGEEVGDGFARALLCLSAVEPVLFALGLCVGISPAISSR